MNEGHTARTCNYYECRSNSPEPCPFVRENPTKMDMASGDDEDCLHEWRQLSHETYQTERAEFFCIFCKKIER